MISLWCNTVYYFWQSLTRTHFIFSTSSCSRYGLRMQLCFIGWYKTSNWTNSAEVFGRIFMSIFLSFQYLLWHRHTPFTDHKRLRYAFWCLDNSFQSIVSIKYIYIYRMQRVYLLHAARSLKNHNMTPQNGNQFRSTALLS